MRAPLFRRPRLAVLLVLVLISAGASAFLTIGRQEDPAITNLFATIVTPWPGADPGRIEALVTEPIEAALFEIEEIKTVASTSAPGVSTVTIELSDFTPPGRIEQVFSEIRDALGDVAARLPPGVPEPDFDDDRTGAFSAISAVMPRHATVPPAVLARHAEALEDRLRGLPGVSLARSFGMPEERVTVEADPTALAALGLSAADLARAVEGADAKRAAGRLRGGAADLLVEVEGGIATLDRIRRIPVAVGPDGAATRLEDVARVTKGAADPPSALARVDGRPAVLIAAKMEDGRQVGPWMDRIRAEIADWEAALPGGLEHRLIFDQSGYTAERLTGVALNMALGVALVVAVLLLTLGFAAAMVVALVLPLVALASLATLNLIGVPLHQMSLTGMIVALGLLVDAAIVMTDEIRRRLAAGLSRAAAADEAVSRLAGPLLASTVTTALAFLPMAILPGPAGDFVGSIAVAVIVMLSWSLAIALLLTPAFAGRLLPDPARAPARGVLARFAAEGLGGGAFGRAAGAALRLALRRPVAALAWSLVLPVAGLLAFPTLTPQFFPAVERDQFHVDVQLPPGAALARTEAATRALAARLDAAAGVESVAWVIGASAPSFYYNMTMDVDRAPGYARALVTAESAEAVARLVPELRASLPEAAPGARVLVQELKQGPPVEAPVELRLYGPDPATLRALGEEMRRIVAGAPQITVVRTTLEGGAPKLEVALDEAAARLAGLSLSEIARQLDAALSGAAGGSMLEGSEELAITVRVPDAARADPGYLARFEIVAPSGARVPLGALGEVRLVPAETAITRRGGERMNAVQGFVPWGVLPEAALAAAEAELEAAGFAPPPGYRLEVGGDSDARAEVVGHLMAPLGLIVTLSAATLVVVFGSFRLAAAATVVMGLSAGLSLLSLAVMGMPFGINAVIGVIGAVGVSVNAAIVLFTALQQDPRAAAGDRVAMADVTLGAARHIVSTTVTTFGGFLPLILAGGLFWPPFAVAVAGGVLLSTVISFLFVPAAFALLVAPEPEPEPAAA